MGPPIQVNRVGCQELSLFSDDLIPDDLEHPKLCWCSGFDAVSGGGTSLYISGNPVPGHLVLILFTLVSIVGGKGKVYNVLGVWVWDKRGKKRHGQTWTDPVWFCRPCC
jgi:hypothetical protein